MSQNYKPKTDYVALLSTAVTILAGLGIFAGLIMLAMPGSGHSHASTSAATTDDIVPTGLLGKLQSPAPLQKLIL